MMRSILTIATAMGAVALLVLAITFLGNAVGLTSFRFWAPQWEDARRAVYEQSDSYVHGKRQYLTRLHLDWQRAESQGTRDAICSTARHEASTLDQRHLPEGITDWECVR